MKKAFGAIDLLIGLLLISVLFIISMNSYKGINIQDSLQNTRSIQGEVDAQINEIEIMRQQSINYQNQILENK